jgi:hypothetical protein
LAGREAFGAARKAPQALEQCAKRLEGEWWGKFGLLVQEQCKSIVPADIVLERHFSADIVPVTLFPA